MSVEIPAIVRRISDKAVCITDGTTEDVVDRRTGVITKREKWFWFPKRAVTVEPEDYEVGTKVMITVPEKLAIEKELV